MNKQQYSERVRGEGLAEEQAVMEPEELSSVASLIRPLPQEVIPSDDFLRRMRGRLLRLEKRPVVSRDQAA